MRRAIVILLAVLLSSIAWGQSPASNGSGQQSTSMPGMSGHDMSNMKDMPMGGEKDADSAEKDASAHVMSSMEGHMDMGPHMKMTALRKPNPDRKSTRLNSSHVKISYAVFCLKKK